MREYITEALVLDKLPNGEMDERVFLYTEELGKVVAKITSGRKITSKLSPHLEPLNFAKVRLIEKTGFSARGGPASSWQVADALRSGRLSATHASFKIIKLVNRAVLDGFRDQHLWSVLKSGAELTEILKILGFDPGESVCERCAKPQPRYFLLRESAYYCGKCLGGLSQIEEYIEIELE